ncbi:hypothetical protein FA95DRAFT_1619051 [Auriscalpium vulgare]|uniref:Uncharacterized protein n=1 Tax=Auriscalpium vulgare TaxID=40419 RepID=A0ACB8R005_9AGAM|nr:hypothetical protein FA95DRAFT_1619051 [Auriscalpium vulgare]
MGRTTFDKVVHVLESNPIFQSTGRKPQRPVRHQLGCFLMRYGRRGSDTLDAAEKMGIGLGTVFLYCRRVTRALREIGLLVVSWGDAARRQATADAVFAKSGLPDCIGMLDGSLIRLTEAPANSGALFYCRKKFPAINIQAVVDELCRFINFEMGWPGSVPDVSLWKQSWVWRHRQELFDGEQYVFADKGSMFHSHLTVHLLIPFLQAIHRHPIFCGHSPSPRSLQ